MIVVKIELHDEKIKQIGEMVIHNIGGRDYEARVAKKQRRFLLKETFSNPMRIGVVTGFPRESYNIWRLVSRAILDAFPEEMKTLQDKETTLR